MIRCLAHNIAVRREHFLTTDLERKFLIDPDKSIASSGTVVYTGPGKPLDGGGARPMSVSVGDKIAFGPHAINREVEHEGETLLLMTEDDVLGILDG